VLIESNDHTSLLTTRQAYFFLIDKAALLVPRTDGISAAGSAAVLINSVVEA
jgi:hypothetical protein